MQTLLKAVITGFGLKLGADIYKLVTRTLGFVIDDDDHGDDEVESASQASREVGQGDEFDTPED